MLSKSNPCEIVIDQRDLGVRLKSVSNVAFGKIVTSHCAEAECWCSGKVATIACTASSLPENEVTQKYTHQSFIFQGKFDDKVRACSKK